MKSNAKLEGILLAQQVKSIARRIEYDADDYDCKWPKEYARELADIAEEYLSKVKKL